jgi:hypothetical protein
MQLAPDQPHSKYRHVYPIIRIDKPFNEAQPTNTLSVVKVLTSQEAAESEVSRLNAINVGKSCAYFWETSRLVES